MDASASKEGHIVRDEEHGLATPSTYSDNHVGQITDLRWWQKLTSWHIIESAGVVPVANEERINKRVHSIFTLWFTLSLNLITYALLHQLNSRRTVLTSVQRRDGYAGHPDLWAEFEELVTYNSILYHDSLYSACIFVDIWSQNRPQDDGIRQIQLWVCAPPAEHCYQQLTYHSYYLVCIPVLLNMATLTGFCVVMNVTASLTLSSITDGHLTTTVGIVVISILSLLVSFCGFNVLHQYEKYAWLPVLIAIVIATGCGGKHLANQVAVAEPETSTILSFGGLIASFMIPWSALASDFATYMPSTTSSRRVFLYTYSGLVVPSVTLLILGAAIGGALPNVPSWQAGYDSTSIGGVLAAMLEPAGGFGKFLLVILALSVLGNIAATMYSISLNFQLLVPALVRVPRAFFAIVITGIVIPVSIKAASSFFESVENFVGVIGYWSAAFVAVIIVEHLYFRRGNFRSYDHAIWDQPKSLPLGIAAISASASSAALFIPCMDQVWYT